MLCKIAFILLEEQFPDVKKKNPNQKISQPSRMQCLLLRLGTRKKAMATYAVYNTYI